MEAYTTQLFETLIHCISQKANICSSTESSHPVVYSEIHIEQCHICSQNAHAF